VIIDPALLTEQGAVRPRFGAPAVSRPVKTFRCRLFSVLAVLGVAVLTATVMAPLGAAFAHSEPKLAAGHAVSPHESPQVIVVDDAATRGEVLAERGDYSVTIKAHNPALARFKGQVDRVAWLTEAGIAEQDWDYVNYIVQRESSWNPNATNKSSGACGLVQALPCSKVPGNGYNPVDNLRWANNYAVKRYGGWEKAYAFWIKNHWW
jgi:hypothetical protein